MLESGSRSRDSFQLSNSWVDFLLLPPTKVQASSSSLPLFRSMPSARTRGRQKRVEKMQQTSRQAERGLGGVGDLHVLALQVLRCRFRRLHDVHGDGLLRDGLRLFHDLRLGLLVPGLLLIVVPRDLGLLLALPVPVPAPAPLPLLLLVLPRAR